MDIYSIFKFLHVLSAMAWFGAGAMMIVTSVIAMRKGDEDALMAQSARMGSLGTMWFLPASGLTLLFGLITTTLGGLWGEAWVLLGLAGMVFSFVTGIRVLEPMGKQAGKLMAEGKVAEAAVYGRRLINIAQFDYSVIVAIIALMVFKPVWTDFITLALIAAALGVAGYFFLGNGFRRAEATA